MIECLIGELDWDNVNDGAFFADNFVMWDIGLLVHIVYLISYIEIAYSSTIGKTSLKIIIII